MNIYVGNLAWKTRQKELKELFENFGEVTNAFIVRDKVTRRSRGFGFVEMADEKDARQAIEKLNNTVFLDRTIIVKEALPKDDDSKAGDSGSAADEEKADKPVEQQEASAGETGQSIEEADQSTEVAESSIEEAAVPATEKNKKESAVKGIEADETGKND